MVADDRSDDVDAGWDEGSADGAPAPQPSEPEALSPDAADKVDTAKSRVVRLIEKPARTDSPDGEPAPPSSARGERTVPPPADYDVVRKTSKNKAFDLEAALQREALSKPTEIIEAPEKLDAGAEVAPEIPAPAAVPASLLAAPATTPPPEEPTSSSPPDVEDGPMTKHRRHRLRRAGEERSSSEERPRSPSRSSRERSRSARIRRARARHRRRPSWSPLRRRRVRRLLR